MGVSASSPLGASGLAGPGGPEGLFGGPVANFFGTLVVLVVLTVVAGRLLGVRLRWSRVLLAGFPGLVAGFVLSGR